MKKMRKMRIFAIVTALLVCLGTVSVYAAEKLDQNMSGENMTFGERFEYAMQGTVTGMLMVFAVLALLYGIVALSKVFLYDLPNKKKNKNIANTVTVDGTGEKKVPDNVIIINDTTPSAARNDEELVAVITAAIAATIESGEYKDEFAGGFRVVSFKRSTSGAWNRK